MENVTPEDEDFPGRLLHQAALWDNAELLEDLLHGEQIAHINSQDSWGRTPLHAAATNDNSRCLGVLLQAGANPNTACGPRGENRTPLHLSAEHGYVSNVQLLLSHGADLMTRDNSGLTPLDISEKGDHVDCMEILKQAAGRHTVLRSHDTRIRGGAFSAMSVVLEAYSGSSTLSSTLVASMTDTTSEWNTPAAEGGAAAAATAAADRVIAATECSKKATEGVLLAVVGTEVALSLAMAASAVAETAAGAAEKAASAAETATFAASAAKKAASAAKTAVWGSGATSRPASSRVSVSASATPSTSKSKSRSSKGSKRRSKTKPSAFAIPCPSRMNVEEMAKEIVVANS